MSFEMRLVLACNCKCWLCGQSYEPDEVDERRITAALFGLSEDWCPVCIQAMTSKQHAKACRKLGRIR
jgi:hypothetical protein